MEDDVLRCDNCGRVIEGLTYRCRRCGGTFCVYCHLPEEHDCPGLQRGSRRERWFSTPYTIRVHTGSRSARARAREGREEWGEVPVKVGESRRPQPRPAKPVKPVKRSRVSKGYRSPRSYAAYSPSSGKRLKALKGVAAILFLAAIIILVLPRLQLFPSVDEDATAKRVLDLINEYRRANGLSALSWSEDLALRAKSWSGHLASIEVLVHSTGPSDRMWGENIFMIEGKPGGAGILLPIPIIVPIPASISTEQLAERAFNGWKNSPGHNANMLHSAWRYAGIGVTCKYENLGYKCYVVAQFSDRP